MRLLDLYLAGFMLTVLAVSYTAPPKVRTRVLIGMSLLWPLTWGVAAYVSIRSRRDAGYREEIHQIRKGYEEDVDGR